MTTALLVMQRMIASVPRNPGHCTLIAMVAALVLAAGRTVTAQDTSTVAPAVTMTLGDALARGRSGGISASLARIAAQGTTLRTNEQRAALLPQIEGLASAQRQTVNLHEFGLSIPGFPAVTDPFTLFRARVAGSQVLFDRATMERLRAARDTAIAAGLDAQRAGELASAAAGVAWLRVAEAQERLNARREDSVTAFALLEIASSQVTAGTAARIERTRSETQAAAVRSQIAVARNDRARAEVELARAVDLPPGTPIRLSIDSTLVSDQMPANIDSAIALAKAHRVDLQAEIQRREVLQRGLSAIRNEFIPTVGASGYLQTSGTDLSEMATTWNVGVALSWSIFDGYRRQRREDEQRLRISAEDIRLRDLERGVEAEVREAALDVASAREQLALATDRVRLAEEELSEARERFTAGVAGSVETTNAQAELAAARDALIQARLAAGAAQVNAIRAMGMLDRVK